MSISLLAIDLDGTLLTDEKTISQENILAIEKLKQNGIHAVLCSGRSPLSIRDFNEKLNNNHKNCYGVGFNGAVAFETDTLNKVFEQRISREDTRSLIKKIKEFDPETPIMAYNDWENIHTEFENERTISYAEETEFPLHIVPNLEDAIGEKGVMKVIINWEPARLKELERHLSSVADNYNIMFSQENFMEIVDKRTSKIEGLIQLGNILGIAKENMATIGDNENDMEMITGAGLGIAMANRIDKLKAVADYTTTANNNEHGLSEAVEYILDIKG